MRRFACLCPGTFTPFRLTEYQSNDEYRQAVWTRVLTVLRLCYMPTARSQLRPSPWRLSQVPRFRSSAIAIGIFIYGNAPETGLDAVDQGPEPARQPDEEERVDAESEPEDQYFNWKLSAKDIIFLGLLDSVLPSCIKSALRQTHVNLGSALALMGVRGLKYAVCLRMRTPQQPRPGKLHDARQFNDFSVIDFLDDCSKEEWTVLSTVDDASTYHVLQRLLDKTSYEVIQKTTQDHFGIPDELLLDADGAMVGFSFEQST